MNGVQKGWGDGCKLCKEEIKRHEDLKQRLLVSSSALLTYERGHSVHSVTTFCCLRLQAVKMDTKAPLSVGSVRSRGTKASIPRD